MNTLLRTGALCAALLLSQTASAQLFRPADNAPPSPPAVAGKLATRGELKGIRVYEMRMVRRNDVLVVEADISNTLNDDRFVYYRFKWMDGGGMQVGDGESWKQLKVMGQQVQTVKAVAPNARGEDFRLEFNVE
ncbi:YcfL family protein [Pseudaquabacterium pictum]|uniref:DUF1425 domain-containing protein n=1 Tax=Pseudaquabacterium pictum TaxID=2315236 RepID=A0A480AK84_9BURK|nr:YcfL family protein [Rubrivivax pictus]GCL61130.1 hypothetical protein AQPW35_02110 [Rubrivivax pictus]